MGINVDLELSDKMLDTIADKLISNGKFDKYIQASRNEQVYTEQQFRIKRNSR